MREIKLRARHLQTGQWFYGSSNLKGEDLTTFDDDILPLSLFWLQVEKDVLDKDTAGEYIGRNAKNGKEIYKGDIVQCRISTTQRYRGVIEFEDAHFLIHTFWYSFKPTGRWDMQEAPLSGRADTKLSVDCEIEKIIGNIYENPELLPEGRLD